MSLCRVIVTTPRKGPLEPLLCHFDRRLRVQEAAHAAALVLGYAPSMFTFAAGQDVLDRTAKIGDGIFELVETGGTP